MTDTPPATTETLPIDVADVRRAAARLAGVAHRTPVLTSATLDGLTGASLFLKAEHLQRVGAFKFRGAYNAVASLDDAARARGVITFSSGNHGQAVAHAAALLGTRATVVMPSDAPGVKLAATRGYGAHVVTYDRYGQDRAAVTDDLIAEHGSVLIPPFDDESVMAGQGTVSLELLEDVADLDVLVVPLGGGGLLSGCAVAARALNPTIEIFGVEPAERRAGRDAVAAGAVVRVAVPRTICDGQQSERVGERPLRVLRRLGVEVVGVHDDAVADAVRLLATRAKQVVEPSGASALAAVLCGAVPVTARRVGVVLSGGNIAPDVLARLLTRHDPAAQSS